MNCHPDEVDEAGGGPKPWLFWSLVTVAVAFMAYGFYLGNPFETYHNGSTL